MDVKATASAVALQLLQELEETGPERAGPAGLVEQLQQLRRALKDGTLLPQAVVEQGKLPALSRIVRESKGVLEGAAYEACGCLCMVLEGTPFPKPEAKQQEEAGRALMSMLARDRGEGGAGEDAQRQAVVATALWQLGQLSVRLGQLPELLQQGLADVLIRHLRGSCPLVARAASAVVVRVATGAADVEAAAQLLRQIAQDQMVLSRLQLRVKSSSELCRAHALQLLMAMASVPACADLLAEDSALMVSINHALGAAWWKQVAATASDPDARQPGGGGSGSGREERWQPPSEGVHSANRWVQLQTSSSAVLDDTDLQRKLRQANGGGGGGGLAVRGSEDEEDDDEYIPADFRRGGPAASLPRPEECLPDGGRGFSPAAAIWGDALAPGARALEDAAASGGVAGGTAVAAQSAGGAPFWQKRWTDFPVWTRFWSSVQRQPDQRPPQLRRSASAADPGVLGGGTEREAVGAGEEANAVWLPVHDDPAVQRIAAFLRTRSGSEAAQRRTPGRALRRTESAPDLGRWARTAGGTAGGTAGAPASRRGRWVRAAEPPQATHSFPAEAAAVELRFAQVAAMGWLHRDDARAVPASEVGEASSELAAFAMLLATLSDNSRNCCLELVKVGVVSQLVEVLEKGQLLEQREAGRALASLCRDTCSHETVLSRSGVLPVLMKLLRGESAEGRRSAAAVAAQLCTAPDAHFTMVSAGIIPALVATLERGDPEASTSVAEALRRLCLVERRHAAVAVRAGAVPHLLALAGSKAHFRGRYRATLALSCLARCQDGREEMVAAGAIPCMISCLLEPRAALWKPALQVLRVVADSFVEQRGTMVRCGVVSPLREILLDRCRSSSRRSPEVLAEAVGLLLLLTSCPGVSQEVWADRVLLRKLLVFLKLPLDPRAPLESKMQPEEEEEQQQHGALAPVKAPEPSGVFRQGQPPAPDSEEARHASAKAAMVGAMDVSTPELRTRLQAGSCVLLLRLLESGDPAAGECSSSIGRSKTGTSLECLMGRSLLLQDLAQALLAVVQQQSASGAAGGGRQLSWQRRAGEEDSGGPAGGLEKWSSSVLQTLKELSTQADVVLASENGTDASDAAAPGSQLRGQKYGSAAEPIWLEDWLQEFQGGPPKSLDADSQSGAQQWSLSHFSAEREVAEGVALPADWAAELDCAEVAVRALWRLTCSGPAGRRAVQSALVLRSWLGESNSGVCFPV